MATAGSDSFFEATSVFVFSTTEEELDIAGICESRAKESAVRPE